MHSTLHRCSSALSLGAGFAAQAEKKKVGQR